MLKLRKGSICRELNSGKVAFDFLFAEETDRHLAKECTENSVGYIDH